MSNCLDLGKEWITSLFTSSITAMGLGVSFDWAIELSWHNNKRYFSLTQTEASCSMISGTGRFELYVLYYFSDCVWSDLCVCVCVFVFVVLALLILIDKIDCPDKSETEKFPAQQVVLGCIHSCDKDFVCNLHLRQSEFTTHFLRERYYTPHMPLFYLPDFGAYVVTEELYLCHICECVIIANE